MFRLRSIIFACTNFPIFDYAVMGVYTLHLILWIGLFYVIFPGSYYRYDFKSQIILIFSIYLIIFVVPNLIFSWLKNRDKLFEPENYFILVFFTVFTSIIFGMMSYALQGVASYTYLIDNNLIKEEYLGFKNKNQSDLKDARKKLHMIELIYGKAMKTVNMPVHLINSKHNWYSDIYETKYTWGDIEIELSKTISRASRGVYIRTYDMNLIYDTVLVKISPIHRIIQDYPLPETNTATTVITYLNKRKNWEINVPIKQILKDSTLIAQKKFNPALDKYIYDALLGVLGNNTGYFKPYSLYGRAVEILKTLFKFFYLGYFVSFLVKRYSIKE